MAFREEINSLTRCPILLPQKKNRNLPLPMQIRKAILNFGNWTRIQALEKENAQYSQRLEKLDEIIERFDSEIILSVCLPLFHIIIFLPNFLKMGNMAKMQEQYPENIY